MVRIRFPPAESRAHHRLGPVSGAGQQTGDEAYNLDKVFGDITTRPGTLTSGVMPMPSAAVQIVAAVSIE